MPQSNKPFLAAVSALALSACAAVGPNFKTPEGPKGPAASGYAMSGDAQAAGVRLAPATQAPGPGWPAVGGP